LGNSLAKSANVKYDAEANKIDETLNDKFYKGLS